MDNFEDFNNMFNNDGEFDYDALGEPDEVHEFEKDDVTYLERIWYQDNGRELKHLSIIGDEDGLNVNGFKITTIDNISPEDLDAMLTFRDSLPLNFLDMLSVGAEKYNNMFSRRPTMSKREETIEEKIERIQEEKELAVVEQRYEDASNLRDEELELKRELELRDGE